MSQKQRLLEALKTNEFVRTKHIIENIKIYQYNSVIHALRKDGWDIKAVTKFIHYESSPTFSFKVHGFKMYNDKGETYAKSNRVLQQA